jgi:hypothetical protein
MALAGSIATMSLTDLLGWLSRARKTGRLVVETRHSTTNVYVSEGNVIVASSSDPRSFFGQIILRYTGISEETLLRAFEKQERSRVRVREGLHVKTLLGRILVDEGLFTEREIQELLRKKVEETITSLYLWERGTFTFHDDEMPPDELVPFSMKIEEIDTEGRKALEEWKKIREVLPSDNLVFEVFEDRVPKGTALSFFEKRVLRAAAEGETASEISLELHSTGFPVNRILYRLHTHGALGVLRMREVVQPEEPAEPTDRLRERGQSSYEQGRYEDTIVVARSILVREPENEEAIRLLKKSEQMLSDSLYEKYFCREDIPYLKKPLDELAGRNFPAHERFILARVNGKWDIKMLIRICPLKECEVLQTLKNLLQNDIIGLTPAPRNRSG